MTIEQIEALVQALCASSWSILEYEADGARLRASRSRPGPPDAATAGSTPASAGRDAGVDRGTSRARTIDTGHTGTLWTRHPLALSAAVSTGSSVTRGQIVAFLQVDEVLSAVIAPEDGTVASQLVEDGSLVGHGRSIFALA